MKRFRYFALLGALMCLASCGGSSAGEISISINGAFTQSEIDSIEHFIFIVADQEDQDNAFIFPSSCLVTEGESTCLSQQVCGFSKDAETFNPRIDFDLIAQGSSMQVRVCALDSDNNSVGAGSGVVENTDGESATISMDNSTPCTGLPSVCS